MFGWQGRVLRIDLTGRKADVEDLPPETASRWLGGNGFAAQRLYKTLPAGVDPFSPENPLIFAAGPLTGTPFPGSGKCGAFAKSPLTGLWGEAYCGGRFGAFLKQAGYDLLVLEGRAEAPVYLWVGEEVEIREAEDLWGRDCYETEAALRKQGSPEEFTVASIGPAGERRVRFACITNDLGHQFGRTGLGAVMGAKNLKAVVVRPGGRVPVAEEEALSRKIREKVREIKSSSIWERFTRHGTSEGILLQNELGFNPVRNYQASAFPAEQVEELSGTRWIPRYQARSKGCATCIMPCSKLLTIPGSRYGDIEVEGPELETACAIGTNLEIYDLEAVARANELCDRLGLDTMSFGVVVGFAMECRERGLISSGDLEGGRLCFGDAAGMLEMARKIAYRRGIGDLLAEGVRRAAKQLGGGAQHFAMHGKGLEFAGYDVRGIKGMGLSFAVSNRGACHLRSSSYVAEINGSFPPLGIEGQDRLGLEGKGKLVALLEDYQSVLDALVLCKFYRFFYTPAELGQIVEWVTGQGYSGEELMAVGRRITDLERLFNCREGVSRKDDTLPPRVFLEPIPAGSSKGEVLRREDLEGMLREYYETRGWDGEGKPPAGAGLLDHS